MMGAYLVWPSNSPPLRSRGVRKTGDPDNAVTEHPVEVGAGHHGQRPDAPSPVHNFVIFVTNGASFLEPWTTAELGNNTYPIEATSPRPRPPAGRLTAKEWDNQIRVRTLSGLGAVGGSAFGERWRRFAGGLAGGIAGQLAVQPGPVDVVIPAPPGIQPRQGKIFQAQVFQFPTAGRSMWRR